MKKILFLSMAALATLTVKAQQYKWGDLFNGSSVTVNDLDVDNAGNKYIIGGIFETNGTVDLDPGPGTHILNAVQGIGFYAKYDADGHFIWAKQLDLVYNKIKVTPGGNLLMAGNYGGNSIDLDPGAGTVLLTAYGNDLVLVSYSAADGSFVSAKQFQTVENASSFPGSMVMEGSNTLDVDNLGNIYLCGSFSGYVDLDLNGDFTNVYDMGTGAGFVLKYDNSYNLIGGSAIGDAHVSSLQIDPSLQATYIAGTQHISVTNTSNIFLAKVDNPGNTIWFDSLATTNAGSPIIAHIDGIHLDQAGKVYIDGAIPMSGFIDFDPGAGTAVINGAPTSINGGNGFLAKYNNNGSLMWAKEVGNSGPGRVTVLAIDAGNRLVCHTGIGTVMPFISNGPLDIVNNTVDTNGRFITLYDTAANLLQYKSITSVADYDHMGWSKLKAYNNEVYFMGFLHEGYDFDPFTPLGELQPPVTSSQSGFLVKYNTCPENYTATTAALCPGATYQFGTQTLSAPGSYVQQISLGGDCDSVVSLELSAVSIDVTVAQTSGTLTANANGATYQWLDCSNNTEISGANGKSFSPTASGDYKVVVTLNGCSDTSMCQNVNLNGIVQPAFAKHIQLYPNPASGQLNIGYSSALPFDKAEIMDITGRNIRIFTLKDRSGHVTIGLTQLKAGVYLLKLIANEEQAVFKFVKQ
ncbi:T9SS type A sorting domain-containing protein [Taibaiella helva]|uniref:T9SS type A sorting domain-containing protein n=1 Tax=Taibaiella helva TaxID=2301235 RepID=UPI000E58DAC0|nr:T9SS type A sorting domain-containing protein [Taibaiella helva]